MHPWIGASHEDRRRILEELGLPVFVKPASVAYPP